MIMPITVSKNIRITKSRVNAVVSKSVKSYANDPFFVKKAEEARKTIERVGLPKPKNT